MSIEYSSPFEVVARHQRTLPVDVEAIAAELGIKVYRMQLGEEISGQLVRDRVRGGSSGFAIYANSDHHPNRQRFTIAHEIAHFILHRDLVDSAIIDDTMYRSAMSNHLEVQANRLAADILMPIMVVKKKRNQTADPSELAIMFGVSKAAMEIRLKSLTSPA